MPVNIPSLHAKLLNIARAQKIELQLLLNRLGAEQFLYRLSLSPYADRFIFKGGSLLTYLIESDRKTKDLDFSITEMKSRMKNAVKIVRSVTGITVDDGITWKSVEGYPLPHPEMDYPGMRITSHFLLGKMRGVVRMDLAIGDVVEPVTMSMERMSYKGKPIFGSPFPLLVYPPETIFAEKLQTVIRKRGQNTRMKDYYDLFKLIEHGLDVKKVKRQVKDVFENRGTPLPERIRFVPAEHAQLQSYWERFLKREKMSSTPPGSSRSLRDSMITWRTYGDHRFSAWVPRIRPALRD